MIKDDWLALSPPSAPKPLQPDLEKRLEGALSNLTMRQRVFINALQENCFVASHAVRQMGRKGPARKTIAEWQQDDKYILALDLVKKAALQRAGIEAASVLLRINELVESGRELIPYTDSNGNTDTRPRDASSASANLKVLASYVGVAQAENAPATRTGPGLVIQFIHGAEPVTGQTFEHAASDAITLPKVKA
jgi:hypothetical protein